VPPPPPPSSRRRHPPPPPACPAPTCSLYSSFLCMRSPRVTCRSAMNCTCREGGMEGAGAQLSSSSGGSSGEAQCKGLAGLAPPTGGGVPFSGGTCGRRCGSSRASLWPCPARGGVRQVRKVGAASALRRRWPRRQAPRARRRPAQLQFNWHSAARTRVWPQKACNLAFRSQQSRQGWAHLLVAACAGGALAAAAALAGWRLQAASCRHASIRSAQGGGGCQC